MQLENAVSSTPIGTAPFNGTLVVDPFSDPGPDDCVVAAGATGKDPTHPGDLRYTGRVIATVEDSGLVLSTRAVHDVLGGVPFGDAKDEDDGEGDGNCSTDNCQLTARTTGLEGLSDILDAGNFKGAAEGQ